MDRVSADYMGMLATVIMRCAPGHPGAEGRRDPVMTAIRMEELAEPYIRRGRSATSRRTAWCCSPPVPETRTFPPTPRQYSGRWRSRPT